MFRLGLGFFLGVALSVAIAKPAIELSFEAGKNMEKINNSPIGQLTKLVSK
jgi:hypothetical protein